MDAGEIAVLIGTALGAAGASFAASWYTMHRRMQGMNQGQSDQGGPQEPQIVQKSSRTVSGQIAAVRADDNRRFERVEEDIGKLENRLDQLQEQIGQCLTTEEFQAHTVFVTSGLHQLTEKVGEVRGEMKGLQALVMKRTR